MIRNIVFDMGNVLVDYDGDLVCRALIPDEEMRKRVYTAVFVSPEWVKLDMGIISEEQGLEAMESRLDTLEEKAAAARCFAQWHLYNMRPKQGMEELVRHLKKEGFGLYICSNASVRLLECYRDVIPAIDCFDGVLFSAEVKCMKPQKEMYEHLYRRFQLNPRECYFIDDLPENIRGARDTGMDGYCFSDGNVEGLRKVLEQVKGQRASSK